MPILIKAGLAHLQFETIDPFLDGNGRIGRLLIILMLVDGKLLENSILYPFYYLKKHHLQYYLALDRVRTHGDFEGWITYYLHAINQSTLDAYERTLKIENLELKLSLLIQSSEKPARTKESMLLALKIFFCSSKHNNYTSQTGYKKSLQHDLKNYNGIDRTGNYIGTSAGCTRKEQTLEILSI